MPVSAGLRGTGLLRLMAEWLWPASESPTVESAGRRSGRGCVNRGCRCCLRRCCSVTRRKNLRRILLWLLPGRWPEFR